MPPSPIPGLGNAFGFQMMVEDRASLGLRSYKRPLWLLLAGARRPGFLRLGFTTFSDNSPQLYLDIDRTMAESLGVTVNDVSNTLQTYLGSTYVNLFNKFNQSFQVRVQADADYRSQLDRIFLNFTWRIATARWCRLAPIVSVHRALGSELVTRYNLYPAAHHNWHRDAKL